VEQAVPEVVDDLWDDVGLGRGGIEREREGAGIGAARAAAS
jgi:hypothetical protein